MISTYHEDYELVCPYYKMGCRVKCSRLNIAKHLKECKYSYCTDNTKIY